MDFYKKNTIHDKKRDFSKLLRRYEYMCIVYEYYLTNYICAMCILFT